ncbi:MAG: LTA synthase family protein [Oscillospiraceae bacterium]|nr:LTA synthase family protein [Oscillospiraceae bacterium]
MLNSLKVKYPLDPAGKSRARQRLLLGLTAAGLVCAGICLGLTSLFFACLYLVRVRFDTYFQFPALVALNVFPAVALVLLLWFVTNRAWLSFAISSTVVLLMSFGNYFKVSFRDDPFVAEDLKVLVSAFGIAGQYNVQLTHYFLLAIRLCVLGVIVLFFLARGRMSGFRSRLIGAALTLGCAFGAYTSWYASTALYDSFENYAVFNAWIPAEQYASHGFLYPFIHSVGDLIVPQPDGYSAAKAKALLAPDAAIDEARQVDILAIQLESFADLSALRAIDFTADPYESWHALCNQAVSGTMISDTMGGGTSNAERSFLTGFLYPHASYRHATASYCWYFAENGYTCFGSHPGHDWFYNRLNVMANLGFSSYDFVENHYAPLSAGAYATDAELFPEILRLYEAADAPVFNFNISYQGHSPYGDSSLVWDKEYVSHDGLSDAAYFEINNYLGGVADTGAHAQALLDALQNSPRPVVVVLYGDHKPTLGSGNSAYLDLGVNLDVTTAEGFENYYSTAYCIWANDAAKAVTGNDFTGVGPTVGPYFLMSEVFRRCGYAGSGYAQLAASVMDAVPVIHSTGVYLTADGTLTDTLSAEDAALVRKLEIAQYYLRSAVLAQ